MGMILDLHQVALLFQIGNDGLAGIIAVQAFILAAQRIRAAEYAEENRDSSWDNADDQRMKKLVEEENLAREEAEYVRLRMKVTDAIQAWFLQSLVISYEMLPNPEMLSGLECSAVSTEEALQNIGYVSDFLKSLSSNVDEKLALDAMCLSITEKTASR